MLIFTRRTGESIKIGHEIDVTILGIQGRQVRIGISAPRYISVHRNEIYDKIQSQEAENEEL